MPRQKLETRQAAGKSKKPKKPRRKPKTIHVPSKVEVVTVKTPNNNTNVYGDLTPRERWRRLVTLYAAMLKRSEGQV